ncbi:MAG: hypothetical protein R2847_10235 [Bacteroidia bacterium]
MSMSEKEKSQTSAYRFCRIDVSDDADALLEQIKIILREGDSHNADVFTDKLGGGNIAIYLQSSHSFMWLITIVIK